MKTLVVALLIACATLVVAGLWRDPDERLFDFKTYYCAANVYEMGQNPYRVENLRAFGGNPRLLGFYYPLSALHLFRPIARLDYPVAHRLWLALKVAALAALFLVWKRWFLPGTGWPVLLAAGLFAFDAATLWDLGVGNITVFEQLCLWTGFAFLLRARTTVFVVCVVLASAAKLLPAAFLLLLFTPALRSRANTLRFAAGVLAVALMTFLPFAADRVYLSDFLRGLVGQHPPLEFNPSLLGVVDELRLHRGSAFLGTGWPRWVLVAVYYAALIAVSRRLLRWAADPASPARTILAGAWLYALVAPRLIIYSYMVAIVPLLGLLLPALRQSKAGEWAVVAAVSVTGLQTLPWKFVSDATPLILLWGAWLALVVMEKTGRLTEASS